LRRSRQLDNKLKLMNTKSLTILRLLVRMRLDASLVATVELADEVSVRVSDSGGAILLAHCEGPLWVGEPGQHRHLLAPGDVMLAGFGAAHIVSTSPNSGDLVDVNELLRRRSLARFSSLRVGSGEVRARFQSALGHWSEEAAYLAQTLLPPLVILPGLAEEDVFAALLQALSAGVASDDRAAPAAVTRLVDAMIAICVDRALTGSPLAEESFVLRAIALIHADDERPSVASLAARLGVPRSRFHVDFKNAVGRSPGEYIRDMALARAARVLSEGGCIAAAAGQAGFASVPSFHTAFRQRYGKTPNDYRRSRNSDNDLSQ
jgi:AraC-like DNA-binding protein